MSASLPTSDLAAMYSRAPVYLWVEDAETKVYLSTAWGGDARIGLYAAGGVGAVGAAVRAAHENLATHVFGYRDRDFGTGNRARWNDPNLLVLAGDALEIENLMLDAKAIAACQVNTSGKGVADVEAILHTVASRLVWWMACRRTLTEIRDDVAADFPEHPSRAAVVGQAEAEAAIVGTTWWRTRLPALGAWSSTRVQQALGRHKATYDGHLSSGAWSAEMSGKELVRDLVGWIWTRKRPPDPTARLDFVRAIAEEQVRAKRIPPEVSELREVLLARAGLRA